MLGLAALTIRSGEPATGARHAHEAFAIYRELGDAQGACRALQVIGAASWSEDDLEAAERRYRQSLEIAIEAGSGRDKLPRSMDWRWCAGMPGIVASGGAR